MCRFVRLWLLYGRPMPLVDPERGQECSIEQDTGKTVQMSHFVLLFIALMIRNVKVSYVFLVFRMFLFVSSAALLINVRRGEVDKEQPLTKIHTAAHTSATDRLQRQKKDNRRGQKKEIQIGY